MPRFYRKSEAALATAQRAKKTPKRIRRTHAKIANRRKDFQHKESRKLADQYGLIVFGNVSPSKLAKIAMAKSVLDAGWAGLKTMTSYKALMRGGMGLEANEAWSTQTCSECDARSGPRGLEGLGNKRAHAGSVERFIAGTPTLPRTFSVADWLRLQKELAHERRGVRSPAVTAGSSHLSVRPVRARRAIVSRVRP